MANPPGRPRKDDQQQRRCSARTGLTPAEKRDLAAKAKAAGVSEAEYIRSLILHGRVTVRRGRADPALVNEVNRLALQLKYAGVTANKLAIAVAVGGAFQGEWRQVARELDEARRRAAEVLERLA